jgi:hypothetical protein
LRIELKQGFEMIIDTNVILRKVLKPVGDVIKFLFPGFVAGLVSRADAERNARIQNQIKANRESEEKLRADIFARLHR